MSKIEELIQRLDNNEKIDWDTEFKDDPIGREKFYRLYANLLLERGLEIKKDRRVDQRSKILSDYRKQMVANPETKIKFMDKLRELTCKLNNGDAIDLRIEYKDDSTGRTMFCTLNQSLLTKRYIYMTKDKPEEELKQAIHDFRRGILYQVKK